MVTEDNLEGGRGMLEQEGSRSDLPLAEHQRPYHYIEASIDYDILSSSAPWSLVVYRIVYGSTSSAAWACMLGELREAVSQTLRRSNPEFVASHELTVIEDEATLAGADLWAAHQISCAWVGEDLVSRLGNPDEWGGSAQVRSKVASGRSHDKNRFLRLLPLRWNSCFYIDEACLRAMDTGMLRDLKPKFLTTDWEYIYNATWIKGEEIDEVGDSREDELTWVCASDYVECCLRLAKAHEWHDHFENRR